MKKLGRRVTIEVPSTKAQRRAGVAPDYDGSGSGPDIHSYRSFLPRPIARFLGGGQRYGRRRRR